MSTALARRLKKLEAIVSAPDLERERRIAEGMCPECGCEHGYLPTNGGTWHCLVCGYQFVLQPGPACMQRCPVEGNRGCNSLQRLIPPTPGHQAWFTERWIQHAIDDLHDSMAPEHIAITQNWTRQRLTPGQPLFGDGETWYLAFERLKPPALVRAVLLLIAHHVETRLTVSLAPEVARVYLSDPDAFPANPCAGCGYPMPARAKLLPDGTYELLGGVYLGVCPICGFDNHPEEAKGA